MIYNPHCELFLITFTACFTNPPNFYLPCQIIYPELQLREGALARSTYKDKAKWSLLNINRSCCWCPNQVLRARILLCRIGTRRLTHYVPCLPLWILMVTAMNYCSEEPIRFMNCQPLLREKSLPFSLCLLPTFSFTTGRPRPCSPPTLTSLMFRRYC